MLRVLFLVLVVVAVVVIAVAVRTNERAVSFNKAIDLIRQCGGF
jgi:uncharacterized membrane protein YciS (DUF1049 family)